jgi:hypothetical protein
MEERNYCQWCYMSIDPKEGAEPHLPEATSHLKVESAIERLVSVHSSQPKEKDPVLLNAPPVKQRKQSLLAFLHG